MNNSLLWIIAVILILLGIILIWKVKGGYKPEPDYRTFFIMGVTWLAFSFVAAIFFGDSFSFFFIMGLVFTVVGIVNKNKWKKPKKLSELPEKERKAKIILITITSIILVLGLVVFLLLATVSRCSTCLS